MGESARTKDPAPLIYAVGEPVEGYAVLRLTEDFWVNQPVNELVWSTPEGYRSILALLAGIGVNRASVSWFEPPDSPFLATGVDQGVKAEVCDPIMFRAIDATSALKSLKPEDSGEFTLAVEDEQLPENEGPWRIVFCPESVSIEKSKYADVKMHIRHFSQALLGKPSFTELLLQGNVIATDRAARSAALLLTPHPTYCLELF